MSDDQTDNSRPGGYDSFLSVDHLKGRLKEHTARGGTITIVSQAILFLINLASTAVLARLLTLDDHGLILMVMPIIGFIYLFKDLGLSQATIQKDDINHRQITMLFWVNCAFSTGLMILTAAAAPFIARFYERPQLTSVTVVMSVGFFLGGLSVQHQALLRRQMRFHMLAFIDIAAAVTGLAAGIGAAMFGLGYWALVVKMLATSLVTEGGVWLACGWRPGLPRFGSGAFSMITFGARITGYNILNYSSAYIANILLGKTGGSEEVALYGRARQILLLPIYQINAPLSSVAISSLSRLTDTPESYRSLYVRILEKIAMITMPCIAGLIAASDWVVLIVLGAQWTQAAIIFAYLGIAALFMPIGNTAGWLFISQGRTKEMFRWGIIDAVLTIVSIVAGIPWGVNGVAAAYAAVTVAVKFPLLFLMVGKAGPVRTVEFYRVMATPFIASVVIIACMIGFRIGFDSSPIAGIAVTGAVTILISLFAYLIVPSSRRAIYDLRTIAAIMFRKNGTGD